MFNKIMICIFMAISIGELFTGDIVNSIQTILFAILLQLFVIENKIK